MTQKGIFFFIISIGISRKSKIFLLRHHSKVRGGGVEGPFVNPSKELYGTQEGREGGLRHTVPHLRHHTNSPTDRVKCRC